MKRTVYPVYAYFGPNGRGTAPNYYKALSMANPDKKHEGTLVVGFPTIKEAEDFVKEGLVFIEMEGVEKKERGDEYFVHFDVRMEKINQQNIPILRAYSHPEDIHHPENLNIPMRNIPSPKMNARDLLYGLWLTLDTYKLISNLVIIFHDELLFRILREGAFSNHPETKAMYERIFRQIFVRNMQEGDNNNINNGVRFFFAPDTSRIGSYPKRKIDA